MFSVAHKLSSVSSTGQAAVKLGNVLYGGTHRHYRGDVKKQITSLNIHANGNPSSRFFRSREAKGKGAPRYRCRGLIMRIFNRIINIPKLEKKHTLLQYVTGEPVTVDGVTGISFKITGISITHTFLRGTHVIEARFF